MITRLNRALNKSLATPAVWSKFELQGAETLTSTSEQFGPYIREEVAKWARVVKQAGINLE